MTTLILIRHGENDFVGKRLAGRLPDVHLNERGQQQALALAQALAGAPVRAIYSSPLERARETAAPLAEMMGLEVLIEPGLNEIDAGQWQGRFLRQLRRLKAWKAVQNQPATFRFPQGETFAEAQARAVEALQRIAERHPDELVACFTHADVIRLVTAYFLNMPLDSFQRLGADTASITVVHLGKDGRVGVPRFNQVVGFVWLEEKKKPASAGKAGRQPRQGSPSNGKESPPGKSATP
ncbi:MAG TPA: phosphoglycerate mutase [Anaerolinea thermolimosa]|uniref:Fructose-2,6-bisphosphatase n=1 Tax=Anaerolinea thermolimosa TaxID=229919 RepID=A0A3D1JGI5_9CHLR|nr:histidine phosphatase family protein [Anaerolinea thermolimosa]GAP08646.1 fructose-2,6-bisphosphatase [Anaerolinea thermolimosa]HCE17700.1 phosphoglycerate mutase [Anaerolinea thermolimosa]